MVKYTGYTWQKVTCISDTLVGQRNTESMAVKRKGESDGKLYACLQCGSNKDCCNSKLYI